MAQAASAPIKLSIEPIRGKTESINVALQWLDAMGYDVIIEKRSDHEIF